MTDNTNSPDILNALRETIPNIHMMVSNGSYNAAAETLARSIMPALIERQNNANKAIAYLAKCDTSEEVENREFARSSADAVMHANEQERIARDEAILAARASLPTSTPSAPPADASVLAQDLIGIAGHLAPGAIDRLDLDGAAFKLEEVATHLLTRETKLIEALEIAGSMIDTPIARRRLGIDGNDERLTEIRSALGQSDHSPAPQEDNAGE